MSGDERKKKKKKKHKKEKKKHKKSKKRSRSSESSSSADSIERSSKSKRKREAKKAAKLASLFGYTNTENPFGDSNLTEQFVWGKKKKRKESHSSRLEAIQEARNAREAREKRKVEMEEQREAEARARERQMYEDWEAKEEKFHLEQHKQRTKIRIKQKREKPIDVIAKNLLLYEERLNKSNPEHQHFADDSVVLGETERMSEDPPYKVFESLSMEELAEVHQDILGHSKQNQVKQSTLQDSKYDTTHDRYWTALLYILLCTKEKKERDAAQYDRSSAIHKRVEADLNNMIQHNTPEELEKLLEQVQNVERTGDVEYWTQVKKGLLLAQAKAVVDQIHKSILTLQQPSTQTEEKASKPVQEDKIPIQTFQTLEALRAQLQPEDKYHEQDSLEQRQLKLSVVSPLEDKRAREKSRSMCIELLNRRKGGKSFLQRDEVKKLIQEERENEKEGDLMPDRDLVVFDRSYKWEIKVRKRKPKWVNKIRTGYEWNRYNQSHYDEDKPPPKTVLGYQFNIFYPDLLNPQKAPSFSLHKDPGSKEHVIIKFRGGAPYEDVGFRILNKEWAKQPWNGYKCVFERGILHLYFNFKKLYYRR